MNDTRFLRFMRHPLTVLTAGAVVSTFLLPALGAQVNREKLLREQRLSVAMEIIKDNMETSRRLNKIDTTLELFQKDNSGPAARFLDFKLEQKELRSKIDQSYLEFDSQAWWWSSQIYAEAKVVNIVSSDDLDELAKISVEYDENLDASTQVLSDLWNSFLREEYRPTDPQNTKSMNETRQKLSQLESKRSQLVMDAVKIFTPD